MPAKQAMKRRTPAQGEGGTEAMPGVGSAASASAGPVVHNVVLGGDAAGQPVNLLELLMEESGGPDRTMLMEAPGRVRPPGRSSADLTMPMAVESSAMTPKPSDFTAVLQAFQPAAAAPVRMPTEPDRPRVEAGVPSRASGYTLPVEGRRDSPGTSTAGAGSGHTQVMNLGGAVGTQVLASAEKPDRVERLPDLPAAEPPLSRASRTKGPEPDAGDGHSAVRAPASLPGWLPWLLVVIAVELLAILIVLAVKR